MVNVMLVDDEVLALDYLKNLIDWEAHGYHVAGCASSGKRALELYEKTMPEIVISDIRMPVMDGLELTRHLKEKNREVLVVLLSAYGDFEYAKKGIEYGVSNYLLKHELSEELLLAELRRVKKQFLERDRSRKICRKYFMEQLIYEQSAEGQMGEEELGNRLFLLFLHKRSPVVKGKFVEERWSEEEGRCLEEVLEENIGDKIFYVSDVSITGNSRIALYRIKNTTSISETDSLIREKCAGVCASLRALPDCRFHMIYSQEIKPGEISGTFRKMSRQIRYAVFQEADRSYPVQELPPGEKKILWGEQMQTLKNAVYGGQEDPAAAVRRLFDTIHEEEKLEACKALMPLLNNLLRMIEEEEGMTALVEEQKLYTMEEIEKDYEKRFQSLHEQILGREEGGYSKLTREMLHYIRKNYGQEMSLDTLGEEFQMNGVYLGQIFKKEVGVTFLKYLTGVRIEEAKRLLGENCTVAETARRVGYQTSQYFSRIFLREAGMKPQEYKRWKEKERKESI